MTVFENYASRDHSFRDYDQYALAKYQWTLTKLADRPKSISVLNVGCGAGLFNRLLLDSYNDLTAIEPDQNVFNELRTTQNSSVKLINKDILEFETHKRFDVIVMHDVLEHIKEDDLAVSKVASLLSPGGVFIGSVPAMPSLFGLHDELIGHYRRYTRKSLRTLLGSEFTIVNVRCFGLTAIPIVFYYSRLKRRPYPIESQSLKVGILKLLWKLFCSLELRVAPPIGTSLLFVAKKRLRQ